MQDVSNLYLKYSQLFFEKPKKVDQDVYLTLLIAPYVPERRPQSKVELSKRRTRLISTTYFLKDKGNKNRPVYKAMFMKTFSLKKDRLRHIAKTVFEGNIFPKKIAVATGSQQNLLLKKKVYVSSYENYLQVKVTITERNLEDFICHAI